MISNQICLKPYVAYQAASEKMSVPAFYDKAAAELASPDADAVVSGKEFQSTLSLTHSLRLKEADLKEVTSELTQRGVSAKVAEGMARQMALGAMALQPGMAAGLSQVFAMMSLSDEPMTQTAVNGAQEFSIKPGLDNLATQMDTTVDGLLTQMTEGYNQPGAVAEPKIQGNVLAASIFRPVGSEVSEFEGKFAAQGLSSEASGAIVSGLLLSAAGLEPNFRGGLNQAMSILMMDDSKNTENFFEKV